MYARSTTVQARPESLDEGIRFVRDEVMPSIQDMKGCIGLSMLVDRSSGRCIVTTAWQSKDDMHATSETVRPLRDRAAEILGGTAQVDEWEIGLLHRDHQTRDGSCARAVWMKVAPDHVNEALEIFRRAALPSMQELEGFASASLMIDRQSGKCVLSVTYDSREAMERMRDRATNLRGTTAQEAGAEILDVAEFELALAHLRVPELV